MVRGVTKDKYKGFVRKRIYTNKMYSHSIWLDAVRKTTKNSAKFVGVSEELRPKPIYP
jgi:hypothetical protein